MNKPQEARAHYEQPARYSTTYYGQIARAKLGLSELALESSPVYKAAKRAALANSEIVCAVEILYATDQRDLLVPRRGPRWARFGPRGAGGPRRADGATRGCTLHLIDRRGALGRGHAFDDYAFPTFGLPRYTAIAPRTSSLRSSIRSRVASDQSRLLSDTVYNVQIGAAGLADDIAHYNGSYVLAFAGYNAGRGRVKEWIKRYGDPRDPKVGPIDWIERIGAGAIVGQLSASAL
jgi:soluble lytic murein transglycosylase